MTIQTIVMTLEQNKESIIKDYNDGISMTTLGKQYNCNSGSIYYKLKEWNVDTRKKQKYEGDIDSQIDNMKKMFDSGLSINQISKNIKISGPAISSRLHKLGCNIVSDVDYNDMLKDRSVNILEMFESGMTIADISRNTGYADCSIWNLLDRNGIDTSKNKIKHTVDETYFEKIDTKDKAYILGMFYSDGNVMPSGKCRIGLQEDDKHILEDMAVAMKYSGGLVYKKTKAEHHKNQYILNIDRQKIAKDLIALGCVPNKSLILTFPTTEQVPYELIPDFIRGVMDGDGSIAYRRRDKRIAPVINCSITSTKMFCDSLDEYLKSLGIISTNFYLRNPERTCTGSLFFGKQIEIVKFLKLIYGGKPNLKLNRKYKQYKEVIRYALDSIFFKMEKHNAT